MLLRGLNAAIVSMTRLIYFKQLLIPDVGHIQLLLVTVRRHELMQADMDVMGKPQ